MTVCLLQNFVPFCSSTNQKSLFNFRLERKLPQLADSKNELICVVINLEHFVKLQLQQRAVDMSSVCHQWTTSTVIMLKEQGIFLEWQQSEIEAASV